MKLGTWNSCCQASPVPEITILRFQCVHSSCQPLDSDFYSRSQDLFQRLACLLLVSDVGQSMPPPSIVKVNAETPLLLQGRTAVRRKQVRSTPLATCFSVLCAHHPRPMTCDMCIADGPLGVWREPPPRGPRWHRSTGLIGGGLSSALCHRATWQLH